MMTISLNYLDHVFLSVLSDWFSAMICESQQWQYSCAVETQPCIAFVEESAKIQIRKLPETRDTRISMAFSAVLTVFTISNGTGCSASGCQFQAAPWGEDNENKHSSLHFENFRLSLPDFFCSLWQCYWNLLSLSLVNKLLSKRLPAEKKTKSPGHIHHRTWTSAVVPCHTWDILGYPLASTSDLPGKRWVDLPVSIWIFLSSESSKTYQKKQRYFGSVIQELGNILFNEYVATFSLFIFSVSSVGVFFNLFPLPPPPLSAVGSHHGAPRHDEFGASHGAGVPPARWSGALQNQHLDVGKHWKRFLFYLTKSWSGKHEEKNNERQLASLLVALE